MNRLNYNSKSKLQTILEMSEELEGSNELVQVHSDLESEKSSFSMKNVIVHPHSSQLAILNDHAMKSNQKLSCQMPERQQQSYKMELESQSYLSSLLSSNIQPPSSQLAIPNEYDICLKKISKIQIQMQTEQQEREIEIRKQSIGIFHLRSEINRLESVNQKFRHSILINNKVIKANEQKLNKALSRHNELEKMHKDLLCSRQTQIQNAQKQIDLIQKRNNETLRNLVKQKQNNKLEKKIKKSEKNQRNQRKSRRPNAQIERIKSQIKIQWLQMIEQKKTPKIMYFSLKHSYCPKKVTSYLVKQGLIEKKRRRIMRKRFQKNKINQKNEIIQESSNDDKIGKQTDNQ